MRKKHNLIILAISVLFLITTPYPAQTKNNDIEKAKELSQRVEDLYKEGRYSEAIPIAKESLSIRENALGSGHPDVAESLSDLAELYRSMVCLYF